MVTDCRFENLKGNVMADQHSVREEGDVCLVHDHCLHVQARDCFAVAQDRNTCLPDIHVP
eukprot:280470-Rhodomonas_salina.1